MKRRILFKVLVGIVLTQVLLLSACLSMLVLSAENIEKGNLIRGGYFTDMSSSNIPISEQCVLINLAQDYFITKINGKTVNVRGYQGNIFGGIYPIPLADFIILPPDEYTFEIMYNNEESAPGSLYGTSYRYYSGRSNINITLEAGQYYCLEGTVLVRADGLRMDFSIVNLAEVNQIRMLSYTDIYRGRDPTIIPSSSIITGVNKMIDSKKAVMRYYLSN